MKTYTHQKGLTDMQEVLKSVTCMVTETMNGMLKHRMRKINEIAIVSNVFIKSSPSQPIFRASVR